MKSNESNQSQDSGPVPASIQDTLKHTTAEIKEEIVYFLNNDPLIVSIKFTLDTLGLDHKGSFGALTGLISKLTIGTEFNTLGWVSMAMCNAMYLSIAYDKKSPTWVSLSLHGCLACSVYGISTHQGIDVGLPIKTMVGGLGIASILTTLKSNVQKEMMLIGPMFLLGQYLLNFDYTLGWSCFLIAHLAYIKLSHKLGMKATLGGQTLSVIIVSYSIWESINLAH